MPFVAQNLNGKKFDLSLVNTIETAEEQQDLPVIWFSRQVFYLNADQSVMKTKSPTTTLLSLTIKCHFAEHVLDTSHRASR